jgi:septal ring factor EnvC (AmiA/AmiB activator)
MDQETLREHLAKLQAQLSDLQHQGDAEARQRLSEMARDINRLIDEPSGLASPPDASLPDRLERIAVQFEAAHPTLAASARRLVDLLGEVGI